MAEVFGCEIEDIPPELGTPVDVLCVVKVLKAAEDMTDGVYPYRLVIRSSQIGTWEAHGMAAFVQKVAFDDELYEGDGGPP